MLHTVFSLLDICTMSVYFLKKKQVSTKTGLLPKMISLTCKIKLFSLPGWQFILKRTRARFFVLATEAP